MIRAASIFLIAFLTLTVGLYASELCYGDGTMGGWLPMFTMLLGPLGGAACGYLLAWKEERS
jgi:hypothetical protein